MISSLSYVSVIFRANQSASDVRRFSQTKKTRFQLLCCAAAVSATQYRGELEAKSE